MDFREGSELNLYESLQRSESRLVPYPVIQEFKNLTYEDIQKKYNIVFENLSSENISEGLDFNVHAREPEKNWCATLRTVRYQSGPAYKIFIGESFGDLTDQQRAAVILSFCLFVPERKPLLDFSELFGSNTRLSEYDNEAITAFVDQLYGAKTKLMAQLEMGFKL